MIVKQLDLKNKIDHKIRYYLLHGINRGLIEETINTIFKKQFSKNIVNYEESEILDNVDIFKESIFNKSLFDDAKTIIINRATDKIFLPLKEIIETNPEDIVLIINSYILEKKSKLRSFFEKQSNTISTIFYEDTHQSLLLYSQNFFIKKKIKISLEALNLIVERSKGDRINLNNEFQKIVSFSNGNPVTLNQINKLTNLAENYELSKLVDSCIVKDKKKTIKILNENVFSDEDNIKILRLLLQKLKRLQNLKTILENNNNVDQVLIAYKPTIFWKDKEIIKNQIKKLTLKDIRHFIKKINFIELKIKKNNLVSKHLINNFILEKSR